MIAGHHAGLYDWPELEPRLVEMRRQRKHELAEYLALMGKETKASPPKVPASDKADDAQAELRMRLLFSALVDADYLDTEDFHLSVTGKPQLRGQRVQLSDLAMRLGRHLDHFQSRVQDSPLNALRHSINSRCAEVGKASEAGVFSLSVPTGGSKTLSSASLASVMLSGTALIASSM